MSTENLSSKAPPFMDSSKNWNLWYKMMLGLAIELQVLDLVSEESPNRTSQIPIPSPPEFPIEHTTEAKVRWDMENTKYNNDRNIYRDKLEGVSRIKKEIFRTVSANGNFDMWKDFLYANIPIDNPYVTVRKREIEIGDMQINDPQNQRRLASQRFQDAYQKDWQPIRDFSKYLEDWEYYLPPYNEQQRMDNLRSKALPVIRNELLRYTQELGDDDEPLRRWQLIDENMPERRRAIRKGKPARFIDNQRRPGNERSKLIRLKIHRNLRQERLIPRQKAPQIQSTGGVAGYHFGNWN
ncbi:predicted protein [Histoplasma capsulatum G186AR]|uniref:Uncharacterized protein n=1 Tax=Ajellomyces capsulatus (strain G186AR / H82 / ATCC MYA-2454 / RMSCC 2432) TaxID=447093 RepID=C0NG00_AJECG|nr:uncharacterized protein HCBG_01816 [Histoplasma capsulatum G186AR]EEH10171.1 predicted protein [Histoplasma capsulatum G186AR]